MKKHHKRWYFVGGICCLLLIGNCIFFIIGKFYPNEMNQGKLTLPKQADKMQQKFEDSLKQQTIESRYGMLFDVSDFQPLYEKNKDDIIYPASLTKVMSAITALDYIDDPNETVTVTSQALEGLVEANASVAGLQAGNKLTYEDLLYALILPSGADAANVLAVNLFGDIQGFVDAMNQKAQSYGMTNTNFVNVTGLHDSTHVTTINDLGIMMKHVWKNTYMKTILTTSVYEIPNLNLSLTSTLLSYMNLSILNTETTFEEEMPFEGGRLIGGKSGYTLEAECCLISIAELADGSQYMFISAKAKGDPIADHYHLNDAFQMYEALAAAKSLK